MAGATAAVVAHGWVSDDAMISLRYAVNFVHGYGPVFNAGERVQGFTHPLWFFLLSGAVVIDDDPVYISVVLGAVLTALTVLVLCWTLVARGRDRLSAVALAAGLVLLWVSSDAWLSFQTSGLENSLSHFIIALLVVEATRTGGPRPFGATLLMGLLFLTRPDFAALVAPLALLVLWDATRGRRLHHVFAGALPVVAWLGFALAYYGAVLPNTANAKLGIYASLSDSAGQGLEYAGDWLSHEPLPAAGALVLLLAGITLSRSRYQLAWVLGLAVYSASMVVAGGDFMRGRFMLPLFVGGSAFGALALAEHAPRGARLPAAVAAVLAAFIAAFLVAEATASPPDNRLSSAGIVNERMFYPGYHLGAYRKNGHLVNSYFDVEDEANHLRAYAERCGPFAVHSATPGTLAYLTGPNVTFIDTLGLTDRFIAGLPRENLVHRHPRPGHPDKFIPVSYLATRGDIAILDGWWDAVTNLDCNFPLKTARYRDSDLPYHPFMSLPP